MSLKSYGIFMTISVSVGFLGIVFLFSKYFPDLFSLRHTNTNYQTIVKSFQNEEDWPKNLSGYNFDLIKPFLSCQKISPGNYHQKWILQDTHYPNIFWILWLDENDKVDHIDGPHSR